MASVAAEPGRSISIREARRPDLRAELGIAGLIIVLGCALQILAMSRWVLSADELDVLGLGRQLAHTGHLDPMAKPMSGGGWIPGSFLQMLSGIPLLLWDDYRADKAWLLVQLATAVLILYVVLRRALGRRHAVIYASVYWLSPWLVYHAARIWEPAFLFLPAAMHFAACYGSRAASSFLRSAAIAATLILTVQIHASSMILLLLTGLLIARGLLKVDRRGALVGLAVGAIPLAPMLRALSTHAVASPLPSRGYFGLGLAQGFPLLKGFGFWFRLSSSEMTKPLRQTLFFDHAWAGASAGNAAASIAAQLLFMASAASVALSVAAVLWQIRRVRTMPHTPATEPHRWIDSYSSLALCAILISTAISPVWIQGWHVVIALHAACMPLAAYLDQLWSRGTAASRAAVLSALLPRIAVVLVLCLGQSGTTPLRRDYERSPTTKQRNAVSPQARAFTETPL